MRGRVRWRRVGWKLFALVFMSSCVSFYLPFSSFKPDHNELEHSVSSSHIQGKEIQQNQPKAQSHADKVTGRGNFTVGRKNHEDEAKVLKLLIAKQRNGNTFDYVSRAKKEFFEGFAHIFSNYLLVLYNVTLQRKFISAVAQGGENIKQVINQSEQAEIYTVQRGYFLLPCNGSPKNGVVDGLAGNDPHRLQWKKTLVCANRVPCSNTTNPSCLQQITHSPYKLSLMLARYEYANVYWNIIDLYNAFLTVRFLNQSMQGTHLMVMDAHPESPLDALWSKLFAKVSRPYQLAPVLHVDKLAWVFARQYSPLLKRDGDVLLFAEFRKTILEAFELDSERKITCTNLRVLFVWRRNYIAHPRNPKGVVARKISNEAQLLDVARRSFPEWSIEGVQLDLLPLAEQLHRLARTDIMIGMHGAAFGFSFLLPQGAVIIEMYPHTLNPNWHMKKLAKLPPAHLYNVWKNKDVHLEDKANKLTLIPPHIIIDLLSKAAASMGCLFKFIDIEPETFRAQPKSMFTQPLLQGANTSVTMNNIIQSPLNKE